MVEGNISLHFTRSSVPVGDIWNYSAGLGPQFNPGNPYTMTLAGSPIPFWDPAHRPSHFAQFVASADEEIEADIQDAFA